MRIMFEAEFHTDGDYGFDRGKIYNIFDPKSSFYNGAAIQFDYQDCNESSERIYLTLVADGDSDRCRYALRDLLEGLILSFHTCKYWLVRDMYDLLDHFLEGIWKDGLNQMKLKGLSGNYSGTELMLAIME